MEVEQYIEKDFNIGGISIHDVDCFLQDKGYAVGRIFKYKLGAKEREKWPADPFAKIHICETIVRKDSKTSHFVVMLEDGMILGPATKFTNLSDYYAVYNIAGIYKAR